MYKLLLGSAFDSLPNTLRDLHRSPGTRQFQGHCHVQRGVSLISRLLARIASLPPAGASDLRITIESNGDAEIWTRYFGMHRMRSFLRAKDGRLHESLGLARFIFELIPEQQRIRWKLLEVRAVGLKLPRQWFDLDVSEYDSAGRYHFDVRVNIRGMGLFVHYAGWLG